MPFYCLLEVVHISPVEQREAWKMQGNHHEHDEDFNGTAVLIQLIQLQ
jgi:hypothetical protein